MVSRPTAESERPEEEVAMQLSYLAVARSLRRLGPRVLGLWPVPTSMSFGEVPRRLATALASLGGTIGVTVPRACWSADGEQGYLRASPLADAVDSLTPSWGNGMNPAVAFEQALSEVHDRYELLLLDLAGLDASEAHEIALLPGVSILFLVAQGRINEFALARLRRRMPPDRLAGAVLVDVRPGGHVS